MGDQLTVGIAQIAPVWLNRDATLAKMVDYTLQAADADCRLVAFGEALLPGYPIWIDWTDGARFDSPIQKRIHAHYVDQAIRIEAGHLRPLQQVAADRQIALYVGTVERAADRGGHSRPASRSDQYPLRRRQIRRSSRSGHVDRHRRQLG